MHHLHPHCIHKPWPITVFMGTSPIVPAASAPSIVHELHDFSALCLGTQNPWDSLNHHCHRPNLPTHYTNLHLKHSNLRPLHPPHPISPPPHSFNSQSNSNLYSQSRRLEPFRLAESHISPPFNIFQIIQHPRGISPTKPKITKNIPVTPEPLPEFQEHTCMACCTCGNIIPHRQDWDIWRSLDISRRTFERRFDNRFGRRFSRRFQEWWQDRKSVV